MENQNFILFTTGWKAYQAILEHDCLWHSIAEQELKTELLQSFGLNRPFHFLDLACGDSRFTTKVLADFPKCQYTGVDSSPEALRQASQFVEKIAGQHELIAQDYLAFLRHTEMQYDCIYSGLVAHHLGMEGLPELFQLIKKRLRPGGVFLAFESFHLADESRDDHTDRLCSMIRHFWLKLTDEYRQNIIDHVRSYDYPVSFQQWNEIALANGLSSIDMRAVSPDRLLAFVAHH